MKIPFNKPFLTGKETTYITEAVNSGKISGNGIFTQKCHTFFEEKFQINKALLTTSCTDALEMAAILANIKEGDEVIIPSYTFVSSALAFVRQGAKVIFADSQQDHPNIDISSLENLISKRTKAIVVVHYAGIANDMGAIMEIANKYNLIVIEDAAQAIDSYYTFPTGETKALGTIGHFGTFSFHETKNIISGEGGLLAINHPEYARRAEIIWEKGTNRAEFFRGEVNKYGWVDTGSSFLPSEVIAAFLWAQLENLDTIQNKRKEIWNTYHTQLEGLEVKGKFSRPVIPDFATNNAHMYYLILNSYEERSAFIQYLKENEVLAVFHYLSLHSSEYYQGKHDGRDLPYAEKYTKRLVRLPFYYGLSVAEQSSIISIVHDFFKK